MANYIVDGAGTSAVNGTYVETGVSDGVPYYVYDTRAIWRWGGSYWILGNLATLGENPGISLYYIDSPAGTPPESSGWEVYAGEAPAPTVTLDEGGGSNTIRSFTVVT
jgi:hypothetical protein